MLTLITPHILTDTPELYAIVRSAVQAGVSQIQLRAKDSSPAKTLRCARKLKEILQEFNVPLIINDDVALCLEVDAAGVHLGQADMPVTKARELLGPFKTIGLSVNSLAQAKAASFMPCDYLGVAPIFATSSKADAGPTLGIAGLKQIRAATTLPLIALGGINENNCAEVIATGVERIAVISAIFNAPNPANSVKNILATWANT